MTVNNRKNLIMRLAVIILVITTLLTMLVGSTFAKYTHMLSSTDTARVAMFYVDSPEIVENSIQIFATAYKGENGNSDIDTVKSDHNTIAPGTKGSFDMVIEYVMEVSSQFTFSFEEIQTPANANIPMVYSVDNGKTWYDAEDLPTAIEQQVNTVIEPGRGEKRVNVVWMWAFTKDGQIVHEQTNEHDTYLGFDGKSQVQLNMSLSVTQID